LIELKVLSHPTRNKLFWRQKPHLVASYNFRPRFTSMLITIRTTSMDTQSGSRVLNTKPRFRAANTKACSSETTMHPCWVFTCGRCQTSNIYVAHILCDHSSRTFRNSPDF